MNGSVVGPSVTWAYPVEEANSSHLPMPDEQNFATTRPYPFNVRIISIIFVFRRICIYHSFHSFQEKDFLFSFL